jgi:hypothetical protein
MFHIPKSYIVYFVMVLDALEMINNDIKTLHTDL